MTRYRLSLFGREFDLLDCEFDLRAHPLKADATKA